MTKTNNGGCLQAFKRALGAVFGQVVGWLVLGLLLGAGVLFAFDYFIGRPAARFCATTGLCSPQRVGVPGGIYIPTVERVQALAELTTTRYNYANIVTGQTDMPALLAGLYGESLVMVAVGHIEAGIDVGQITQDSITVNAATGALTINLPAPTLQNCFLDEGESYIAQRSTGIFARPSPNLDTATRRYAIAQFREQALEDGILNDAATEALAVVSGFLGAVSEAEINVVIDPIDPDAPWADTCG